MILDHLNTGVGRWLQEEITAPALPLTTKAACLHHPTVILMILNVLNYCRH
jgi:hypothetical protein